MFDVFEMSGDDVVFIIRIEMECVKRRIYVR